MVLRSSLSQKIYLNFRVVKEQESASSRNVAVSAFLVFNSSIEFTRCISPKYVKFCIILLAVYAAENYI